MANLKNTLVTGNLKVTGTITASSLNGSLTGNASSATKLATVRYINDTSFDGTKNIRLANSWNFNLGASADGAKYVIFARMGGSNTTGNQGATFIITDLGNYGGQTCGAWLVHISNRGSTPTMKVSTIRSADKDNPTFGYYKDTTNNYFYFGVLAPSYRSDSNITILRNNGVGFQKFSDSTTAPNGWTAVTSDTIAYTTYNVASATNTGITNTNPTSGTWYYPTWVTGTSGNLGHKVNNGYQYYTLEGTTSAAGKAILQLGNNIATGNAGNKYGEVKIYNQNTGYTAVVGTSSTSNYTITLPAANGTVSLNGHTHNYLPLSGGTITHNDYNAIILKRNHESYGSSIQYRNSTEVLGTIGFGGNKSLDIFTGTNTDNSRIFNISPNKIATFYGNVIPSSNNTLTLGTSSLKWNNVYATTFTGALSGNASSATKLATARKINGVSFDGTGDINIRKVAIVGSDAASSKGWYKAVSGKLTGYSNVSMLFTVHSTNDCCSGILQLDLRCDNGNTVSVKKFGWLTRYGFSTSNFIINVSGNNWAIYENVTSNQYYRTMFEVIQEGDTSSFTTSYTLHSNVAKESTAPTATVTSSDLATVANVSQKITASSKTHTNYNTNQGYLATMSFLSFWNGAHNSGGSSNLTYCHKGTICGSSDASTTNIRAMSASTYSSSASSLPNGSLVAVW